MTTVQPGGLILITGANGYIASIAVQQALERGFKVRGTVRSIEKNKWMLKHFGPNLELVEVPDLGAPNAFDEAVKGVDGVAHLASSVNFSEDKDVDAYIDPVVRGAVGILEAAAKEPKVKSVVYCSSQGACIDMWSLLGKPYHIDANTWNDEAVKMSYDLPEERKKELKLPTFYCASKTLAEKKSFEWVKEHKPHFQFNSVVPNVNIGDVPSPENTGFPSSSGLVRLLFNGNTFGVNMIPPEWYVDPEDTALLHIAALTEDDVKNERLMAFGEQFSYNQMLDVFRKVVPDRKFLDKVEEAPPDQGTVANERSVELLKRLGKKNGFSTFEEGVTKTIKCLLRVEKEGIKLPETEAERVINAASAAEAGQS